MHHVRDNQARPATPLRGAHWLLLSVALGAALRVVALGYRSFWLDEIASVVIARMPGLSFWSHLWRDEGNMALYYVFLRGWLHLGVAEGVVRSLSVIPGILTIPLMYLLGARLFEKRTGELAAFFAAISACAISVSQEARAYSLLVLGVLASTYLFVRLIEKPTYGRAAAFGLAAGVALYFHYFATLVPAALFVSLTALPPNRRPWKHLAVAAVILAVMGLPVLWMIRTQNVQHLAWVGPPSWLELYHLGGYLAAESGKAVGGVLLAIDLVLIFLFMGALISRCRRPRQGLECWRYALLASCLVTPIVISLLVSITRPVFHHRFLVICLPAWILMTAVGVERIRNAGWRTAAIAGVALLSLVSSAIFYTRVREDWRGVARHLVAAAGREDIALYHEAVAQFAVESYRSWLDGRANGQLPAITIDTLRNEESQKERAPRAWLVLYRARPEDQAVQEITAALLNQHFAIAGTARFRSVTVVEYRSRPSPP